MGRKYKEKKKINGSVIFVIIIFMLIAVFSVFCYMRYKKMHEKNNNSNISAYDASILQDTDNSYNGQSSDIYAHNIEKKDNSLSDEELSEFVQDNKEMSDRYSGVYKIINKVLYYDSSDVRNFLAADKLLSSGYSFDNDVLEKIRANYKKITGTENYELIPYDIIEAKEYSYCMIKVVPVKRYSNGEKGYDYAKAFIDTYTLYNDGKILPFAVGNININTIGVHKNNIIFEK